MHKFRIFKHPVLGAQAVKVGFSWPALFLGSFWLMSKKLWPWVWKLSGVYLACVVMASMIGSADNIVLETLSSLILLAGHLSMFVAPALKGNEWLEIGLMEQGYAPIETVVATDANAAMVSQALSELERHRKATLKAELNKPHS